MDDLPTFVADEWFDRDKDYPGLKVALVKLDRERYQKDIDELSRSNVIIDGKLYRCLGVERFMHGEPWHEGERVGLGVIEIQSA